MFGFDDRAFGEHHGALQQVVELAHVAGPGVGEQQVRDIGRKRRNALPRAGALLQQMGSQRQDVVAAFAQRRQRQGKYVEAVVEIFAEAARGHFFAQQPVGGGDDAHVERHRRAAAEAFDFTLLQNAQQFGLQCERHFGDFVEQDACRPAPVRTCRRVR